MDKIWNAERMLRFCPECGKELERHPISATKSCFVHGDFIVRGNTDQTVGIEWISFAANKR